MQGIAVRWGFRLYNKNLSWLTDPEFLSEWSKFPGAVGSIHERRFNLFNLSKIVRDIPGDLAECGVYHGAGSYLMLSATEGTDKTYYGFDSFEGLSAPKQQDVVGSEVAFRWEKNDLKVEEDIPRQNLVRFSSRVVFYKGWIPERFNEVSGRVFSMVHIDVDLYEPTRDALEFFFPRLSVGGVVVCDDYGFETCPGARKAMDEIAERHSLSVVHLTTGQGIIIKRASNVAG